MSVSLQLPNYNAPDKDTSEISLFGPGRGESIVLHDNGEYYIIDSCKDSYSKLPAALNYLEKIGVNLDNDVKGIIVSHWHSDHIGGVEVLIKRCSNARIWFSDALLKENALDLVSLYDYSSKFSKVDDDISEFSKAIIALFKADYKRHESISVRTTIFQKLSPKFSRLVALSPSSNAIKQSIQKLTEYGKAKGRRFVVPQSDNLNSTALYFESNGLGVLLGADLEKGDNSLTGWQSVLESDIFSDLGFKNSSIYKVPHHGSNTGHCDEVVSTFLLNNCVSILTPFSNSKLPLEEDIKRINGHSEKLYITALHSNLPEKRTKAVDKLINYATKNRKVISKEMGHIQIRWTDRKIEVRLNSVARELSR